MKKLIFISLCLLIAVGTAQAEPVEVYTENDPVQDDWSLDGWMIELGNQAPFPDEERITSSDTTTEYIPCPSEWDSEGPANVEVTITNMTGVAWDAVYYVADPNTTFTNMDELVGQVGDATPDWAFKIDSIGLNTPLVSESMTANDIFEVGEIWKFVIQNYANGLALAPSLFASRTGPGIGAISSFSSGDVASSGSIIVPEPATLVLLALGGLLLRRRKSA